MRNFIEKCIILLLCLYNTFTLNESKDVVLFFLLNIIISLSLDLLKNKNLKYSIYLGFIILCFIDNIFIFYLPLILYNMYFDFKIYCTIAISLILIDFSISNLLVSFISIYLSINTNRFDLLLNQSRIRRDKLKEDALYLKKYSEQLKIDRKKDTHIAILTERNRIARELHDSIGHCISSSILQVQALKVISKDNSILDNLNLLIETLNSGMNDIRSSIHNLYKESFDLKAKIENICSKVHPINVELIYSLEDELDYNLKLDILSIIKETITNSIKHSNATEIKVTLLSQPKFYSIVVKDNGTNFDISSNILDKGIGLCSMKDIASKYNGFLNYKFDNGFKIHLTLMKG